VKVDIVPLANFDRRLKRLAKKFKGLRDELIEFRESIREDPTQGKSLGAGLYKIRLASKSKGSGKSGGFRVVTYYVEQIGDEQTVYLVTIYDKSEEDSIDKDDLLTIVQEALADPDEAAEPEVD
jgi:hypothetical protein